MHGPTYNDFTPVEIILVFYETNDRTSGNLPFTAIPRNCEILHQRITATKSIQHVKDDYTRLRVNISLLRAPDLRVTDISMFTFYVMNVLTSGFTYNNI